MLGIKEFINFLILELERKINYVDSGIQIEIKLSS